MKVAIVGYGSKLDNVPWYDAEVWGFNPPDSTMKDRVERGDVARWYELHDLRIHRLRREYYLGWLTGLEIPCYTLKPERMLQDGRVFPRHKVERLSKRWGRYHCGSVDLIVAHAIVEGATTISLHGMDYRTGEPDSARACLEFWLGFADCKGIEVIAEDCVDVMHYIEEHREWVEMDGMYGYDVAVWPDWAERVMNGDMRYRPRQVTERPAHYGGNRLEEDSSDPDSRWPKVD